MHEYLNQTLPWSNAMKKLNLLFLILLMSPLMVSVSRAVPTGYDLSWPTYQPCAVGDPVCDTALNSYNMEGYCNLGAPTNADVIGAVLSNSSPISFTIDINPGQTVSCYIRAIRIADNVPSGPSGVVTDTVPFPNLDPRAPLDPGLKRQ